MADVPGVLIFGDGQVQGGLPGLSTHVEGEDAVVGIGRTPLHDFNDLEVMRVTPDNPANGAPTSAALGWKPWFDEAGHDAIHQAGSGVTASTVTVQGASPGWTVNEHIGKRVYTVYKYVLFGINNGFRNIAQIQSNTADTLTIVGTWDSNPVHDSGTPTNSEIFFIAEGRFGDYHPCGGYLTYSEAVSPGGGYGKRGGSNNMPSQNGIGPDAGLIRKIWEQVWDTDPYFQMAKYATFDKIVNQLGVDASLERTQFTDWLARVDTAWALIAGGDTLVWDTVILDLSQRDVLGTAPVDFGLYEPQLIDFIAFLRTTLGNANLTVLIGNHDEEINAVNYPLLTAAANGVHRDIARDDANTSFYDLTGVPFAGRETTSGGNPNDWVHDANKENYSTSAYWGPYADKVVQSLRAHHLGAAPPFDGAIPAYLFIGDSIMAGPITETYAAALNSPTLTGNQRPAAQQIWDDLGGSIAAYHLAVNSNTSGGTTATGGPEFSALVELEKMHPYGFVIVKRGVNGSGLSATNGIWDPVASSNGRWAQIYGENYPALQALWARSLQYSHEVLGIQLDLKGIMVDLGTNDAGVAGAGDLFATDLPGFVSDLRLDFATRTSGDDLPVIWRRAQLDAGGATIEDEIYEIRRALEEEASADAQLLLADVDDLERNAFDNLHETPESCITQGQRLVEALREIAI